MFKHYDDDGDLSIFAKDDELLFACNKHHYWIVSATQRTAVTASHETFGPSLSADMIELRDRFGPEVMSALGME